MQCFGGPTTSMKGGFDTCHDMQMQRINLVTLSSSAWPPPVDIEEKSFEATSLLPMDRFQRSCRLRYVLPSPTRSALLAGFSGRGSISGLGYVDYRTRGRQNPLLAKPVNGSLDHSGLSWLFHVHPLVRTSLSPPNSSYSWRWWSLGLLAAGC